MPIWEDTEAVAAPFPSVSGTEGTYSPTFWESLDAFVTRETSAGVFSEYAATRSMMTHEPQPDYDPMEDITGYEAYADDFKELNNPMDVYLMKQSIDTMRSAKETIASSGGVTGIASMVTSQALDPLNLIPGFGAAKGAAALNAVSKVGLGVTAGATAAGLQEATLYALDPTRTGEEVAYGISGGAIIGGALGGAAALFEPTLLGKISKDVEKSFKVLQSDDAFDQVVKDYSIGAAQTTTFTKEGQQISSALGAEKLFDFNDPVIRTLSSESLATQELSERLARTALLKEKYKSGVASHIPVEERIAAHDTIRLKYYQGINDIYARYRTAAKERGEKPLSYGEFGVEVTKANRRGDKSDIQEVSEAAQFVRKTVYDPYLNEADKVGLIGKDKIKISTAESYAPRVYNRDKIRNESSSWKEKNLDWFKQRREGQIAELDELSKGKLEARISKINEEFENQAAAIKRAESKFEARGAKAEFEINKLRKKADAQIEDLKMKFAKLSKRADVEDEYLEDAVETLTQRVLGTPYGRLKYDMAAEHDMPAYLKKKEPVRGPLKQRVYDIPDEYIEDYLVNDLDHIVEAHIRTMSRDIEVFREFGTLELEPILKLIKSDYDNLKKGKSDKEIAKLQKQMERDMSDVGYMVERLRGIDSTVSPDYYGSKVGTAERIAMKFNYVRLLGGMTLSAMSDISRPIMMKGMLPFLRDGVVAFATDMKNFRKAARELRDEAGIGLDMVLNTRIRSIMGVDDYAPPIGKFENALDKSSQVFGNLTLMNPWNATMKQFSGVVVQSQMIKAMKAVVEGSATQKQVRDLASSYIDENMAKQIVKQLDKYGDSEGAVQLANMGLWDDKIARETFNAAIRREVDNIIITPGLDRPKWLTKPGLRLVGQFRSFGFSSMQKALISGLQRRDMEMLNGLMVAVALGTMSRMIKSDLAGYELSDDPAKLILEGIDASGVTGWLMDANNIMEKVTAGRIGANALIGQAPMSRYASRSALSSIVGPTYGLVGDSLQLSAAAFGGDWKASDTHTLRQLLPFNNIFWLRQPIDMAEDNLNKYFGVPDTRKKARKR